MAESVDIRVLTFNLWGIFNSRVRQERMAHFASKVEHYDLILLQEQFSPEDFELIIQKLPKSVRETRYFRRFPSSFYGSGCAVISKYPIRSAFFFTYPLQGYPEMILHGDFFANKGAALVKLEVPIRHGGVLVTQEVSVYTTHLVAIYQKVSRLASWRLERYLPYRISQAISLAEFVCNTSKPSDCVIIAGDFNCSQRSLEVQVLLVLLKRRGYAMRSVLPTPSTLLETATSESDREAARSLYTFSHRNFFNSMKTSYFKLLNMQSDIPAQIDHMFFSNNTFKLRGFEHCPDAAPGFPFFVDVDGAQVPSGVVVFTQNEVAIKRRRSLRERAANALRSFAKNKCGDGALSRGVAGLAELLYSPPPTPKQNRSSTNTSINEDGNAASGSRASTGPSQQQRDVQLVPLSDHYGLAAYLHLRDPASSPLSGDLSQLGAAGAASALSEEEIMVVNSVVNFLDSYVKKLRHQVTVTRYMAGVSFAIVILNVYVMKRAASNQEERTTNALRQLYAMANLSGQQSVRGGRGSAAATASSSGNNGSDAVQSAAKKTTAFQALMQAMAPADPVADSRINAASASTTATTMVVPDFGQLSHELCARSMWTAAGGSTLLNVGASIVGTAALAIGMFQRMGNANILEDQVRKVRLS